MARTGNTPSARRFRFSPGAVLLGVWFLSRKTFQPPALDFALRRAAELAFQPLVSPVGLLRSHHVPAYGARDQACELQPAVVCILLRGNGFEVEPLPVAFAAHNPRKL